MWLLSDGEFFYSAIGMSSESMSFPLYCSQIIILNYQCILLFLKSIVSVRNDTHFINISEISEVVENITKCDIWITSIWSADFETESQF